MNILLRLGVLIGVLGWAGCGRDKSAETSSPNKPESMAGEAPPGVAPLQVPGDETKPAPAMLPSSLSAAVVEALNVSATRAVEYLTGPEGMLQNTALQIPLPEAVEKLRKPLDAIGQEALLDRFSETMNSAATEALKLSPEILSNVIGKLTIQDVTQLMQGGDDAFTQFLDRNSRSLILVKIQPLITAATDSSGATQGFKQITDALGGQQSQGLFSSIKSFTGVELPAADFDLDQYIADQAVTRLFQTIAVEEQKMRADPKARSTELIKSLFDQFKRQ